MLIHPPEITVKDGTLTYRARIEHDSAGAKMPRYLWFKMPAGQEKYLSPRSDGLAVNLLWAALLLDEPLRVRGTVSTKLAKGVLEYRRAVGAWERHTLKPAPLEAEHYSDGAEGLPQGVGLPFSGGVDSFFSLKSHLAAEEAFPSYRITHGIFLIGVDLDPGQTETIRACVDAYRELFAFLGLELLVVETNIRAFYPNVDWIRVCYTHLAGVGLLFGKLFHRLYLAAGETYGERNHFTQMAMLSHLMSSETLELIHDGLGMSRAAKVEAIASWKPARENLRVCYTLPNKLLNCCRCGKCLHTLACLDLAGGLNDLPTFPYGHSRHRLRTTLAPVDYLSVIEDTRRLASARGRHDIAFDLRVLETLSLLGAPLKAAARKVRERRESIAGSAQNDRK